MENVAAPLDWDEILPKETGLFYRHRWQEYADRYGVPFSRGTMQNLDCEGKGPEAVVIAGKIAYRRGLLVKFLNSVPVMRISKRTGKAA